jgi:hypothetical protein
VNGSSCCELLVAEAQGQYGSSEDGERLPLEAATKQQLVKNVTDRKDLVFPIFIC